jgi:CheY-like chemotaxis protein
MLTSQSGVGDSQPARVLGVADYLTKPIFRLDLLRSITKVLDTGEVSGPTVATVAHQIHRTDHPLSVLLAEDNEVNQRVARAMLEGRGHTVEIAENGREAVAAVQKKQFDVVLMDIQMPEVDGYAAVEQIRAMPRFDKLPIVALTAHAMAEEKERTLMAGMDGFLSKPFRSRELFDCVESFSKSDSPSATASVTPSEGAAVDLEGLIVEWESVGLGGEFMKSLVDTFIENTSRQMESMKAAVADHDIERVGQIAHNLKSSSGSVRAIRISELFRKIEIAGMEGKAKQVEALASEAALEFDVVRAEFLKIQ